MNRTFLDFMFVVLGMYFLEGAVRGAFYTSGRGSNRPAFIALKWPPLRVLSGLTAISFFAWAIRGFVQRSR